jgi:hypothetical protein
MGPMRQVVVAALVGLGGCGGEEANVSSEPQPRAEAPVATPTEARSDRECMELWNSTLQFGSAGQKAPADYVTEIAADRPMKVVVQHVGGDCVLFVPFKPGSTRGWGIVATGGRAPYHHPGQVTVPPRADLAFNARAKSNGILEEAY